MPKQGISTVAFHVIEWKAKVMNRAAAREADVQCLGKRNAGKVSWEICLEGEARCSEEAGRGRTFRGARCSKLLKERLQRGERDEGRW